MEFKRYFMAKVLGLDIGTNSIGWALVEEDRILGIGSRVIPMDQAEIADFDKGVLKSKTAQRTAFRGARRLYSRDVLRRERLHRVLNGMRFLPPHYCSMIDAYGKFIGYSEPKLSSHNGEFIFKESFNEMISDFSIFQPQLLKNKKGEACKIPHDWTIYYLRKKALTKKITKEELAWILLNFNSKRGYYQLRAEDEKEQEKSPKTRKEFITATIVAMIDTGAEYKGLKVLEVVLDNGLRGKIFKKEIPSWVGETKSIIATIDIDKEGKDKIDDQGGVNCRFSIPTDADWDKEWGLVKLKTEKDLESSGKSVGCYIYDTLLSNPNTKIIGKLVRVIERKFYKAELKSILDKQREFHAELRDEILLEKCVRELYRHNEPHVKELLSKDFTHLFLNDILFYQRPLKSKKSLISNCRYEYIEYNDGEGNKKKKFLKSIPKSNPLYQQFRILHWLKGLQIIERERIVNDKIELNVNVTPLFINDLSIRMRLFDWLNDLKEINQEMLLKSPILGIKKGDQRRYRWNYVEDKSYPMNETRAMLLKVLNKEQLTDEIERKLWHLFYSVSDKEELRKALSKFEKEHGFGSDFSQRAITLPLFEKDYGAYSEKAIKKLLALMRFDDHENLSSTLKTRLEKILNGEFDETIPDISREKLSSIKELSGFRDLPLWLACYAIYGFHSEQLDAKTWNSPEDIDVFLSEFKQHELRNPIVERVVAETLRVVRDLWRKSGNFSEIHIELGREMKNPTDKRKRMTEQQSENENTNIRLKLLLSELSSSGEIDGVRAFSPNQLEKLKIYEQDVLCSAKNMPDDILKISKMASPSKNDLTKYKLWLEQGYRSPYTGRIISLSKLFTNDYQIEHVIPKKRYFDDSISNKVICESVINGLKNDLLGFEFIKKHSGEIYEGIKIVTKEEYLDFIKDKYSNNRNKMKKMLLDEIPEEFISRQLNDTRYISKYIKGLLSNIVRTEDEKNAPTSKHILSVTGGVTSILKQEWGLNDVWNDIIYPRFERLNKITGSNVFGDWDCKQGKRVFQTMIPIELQKGFSKKRIDHRHHALDALVIAATSRNCVNYLNNSNAAESRKKERYDIKMSISYKDSSGKLRYKKPWETFTGDARKALQDMLVSFKINHRIINKTTNRYQRWELEEGTEVYKKSFVSQNGVNWAIRQPLHKATVKGIVHLRVEKQFSLSNALDHYEMIVNRSLKRFVKNLFEQGISKKEVLKRVNDNKSLFDSIDQKKVSVYSFEDFAASRIILDETFVVEKEGVVNRDKIEKITDKGIRKILINHLDNGGSFTAEGIQEMNKNITTLNSGKSHKPIRSVRVYEVVGSKFSVGSRGSKSKKFVEAEKGTNLFAAIYIAPQGKRSYRSIPLNEVIEREKQGLCSVPEQIDDSRLLITLSPGDLVYLPNEEEIATGTLNEKIDYQRVYKMVSCTGSTIFFIPHFIASPIVDTKELGSNNKSERAWSGETIKEICLKLEVDRLGNIIKIGKL